MKKLLSLWMFLPIFLVLAACSDNSEDIDRYYATVSTPKVTTTTPTWATWLADMNGAKVTVYVTNCGNGTTDIQAVMEGTSGTSYAQYYLGINKVDMNDLNFALTIEGGHLVF